MKWGMMNMRSIPLPHCSSNPNHHPHQQLQKTLWVPFCTHTIVSFVDSWSASFSPNRYTMKLCRMLESNSRRLVSCNICKFKKQHPTCCSWKLKWPLPIQALLSGFLTRFVVPTTPSMKLLVEFFNKWIWGNLME
jgi:hypothetical protein